MPGFSKYNKEWANEIRDYFRDQGISLEIVEWNHWETGAEKFDKEAEREKVINLIGKDEVAIVSKSIGTRLLANMLKKDNIKPSKVIMMGIPSLHDDYKLGLSKLHPENIKMIQNTGDNLVSFEQIDNFVKEINQNIEVIETGRMDHNYPFPDLILELLTE